MAKTGKIKKKPATIHSRAARRAASPSIDLDKSLKPAPAPSETPKSKKTSNSTTTTPSSLTRPSGITKSKSKSKPLKRQQRVRQTAAMEKAYATQEKFELKVQKSVGKEKKVGERKKGWEDVNTVVGKEIGKGGGKKNPFETLEEEREKEEREWVSDEEMDAADGSEGVEGDSKMVEEVEINGEVKEAAVPEAVPLPAASAVEEDELL